MRDTFEPGCEKQSPAVRDAWVIAVAQWILCSGQKLFKLTLRPRVARSDGLETLTPGIWQDWRNEVHGVTNSDEASEECRIAATRAARLVDVTGM